MDEDNDDLFDKKDLRKRKDKKRAHKQTKETKEKDDYAKESFKRMKEELEEMRKREMERAKEFDNLKKKIEDQERHQSNRDVKPDYALGFDRDEYLNKGFIESAKWIKDVIAKNMSEKMSTEKIKVRFEGLMLAKKSSNYLGVRACARFNRGEDCHHGKWHTTHKQDGIWTKHGPLNRQDDSSRTPHPEQQGRRNELRLLVCTLCIEALGSAYGHSVLDCPWIDKKNWCE